MKNLWFTQPHDLEILEKDGAFLARMLAFWAACPRCQVDLGLVSGSLIVCGDCRTIYEPTGTSVFLFSVSRERIRNAAARLARLHPAIFAGEHEINLDLCLKGQAT